MKKIIVMAMALALCLSLCACGSYRMNNGVNNSDTAAGQTSVGTTDTGRNNGTADGKTDHGSTGTNKGQNGNNMMDEAEDMTPDARDGYVEDEQGEDGMITENPAVPSPRATQMH